MPRLIPRLPFLKRDRTRPAASAAAGSGVDRDTPSSDADPATADLEELGPPPVLRPAAIFRQLLWDPNELDPIWARPRASATSAATDAPAPPEPVVGAPVTAGAALTDAPADAPKAARRTRRPKAEGASAPSPTTQRPTKPRRAATPKPRAGDR